MQFQATNAGDTSWQNYGSVNTLGGSFTDTDITSTRDGGVPLTETFEPVPTKPRLSCKKFTPSTTAAATFGASVVVSDARPVAAAIEEISGRSLTRTRPFSTKTT
jgi:hypothetical protein